jgi:membrane protein YdbS with pleckstrin-like domain
VVSADDGVSVADRLEHSLDPAWIEMQRLIGWILCAVLTPLLLTGLIVAWFTRSLSLDIKALLGVLWLAAVILLAWAAQKWPAIEYRYFRYVLDADGIEIRCGVVWRKLIRVPRSRVQHIDVDQGPLERRHGIASLSIHTAGTEFAQVLLPGLRYARAIEIRDGLLPGREQDADDGT